MPFFVVLQYEYLLQSLDTVVVAPLLAQQRPQPATRLNPTFTILGQDVLLATQLLAGVSRTSVGPTVATLLPERDRVVTALDALFTGL
jgi:toxin CcdB